jgi:hypothetical protein
MQQKPTWHTRSPQHERFDVHAVGASASAGHGVVVSPSPSKDGPSSSEESADSDPSEIETSGVPASCAVEIVLASVCPAGWATLPPHAVTVAATRASARGSRIDAV